MRLKVSVRRYSLPTTNIIFTTRALGPSPATSSTDATIAQLLEDVNDIVPLESADWGLEDYAVEVNGPKDPVPFVHGQVREMVLDVARHTTR